MPRLILSDANINPALRDKVASRHRELVTEVATAVERDPLVIVGMAQNPHCKRARKAVSDRAVTYLEYGSYLSKWRERLALKMWSGWPTFPMVFVNGQLIGGADELEALVASKQLDALLSA